MSNSTSIFSPLRTVGNIMGDKPVSFTMLYEKPCLMVPVGRTFHIHGGIEMHLLRGGPTFESEVTAVSHFSKYRFCAEGGRIHAFSHHKKLWTKEHSQSIGAEVTVLYAIDALLFSLGADNKLVVWEYRTGEILHTVLIPQHFGQVSAFALPRGYTNKVLIGTSAGFLLLYNFRTEKLLFSTDQLEGNTIRLNRITSLIVHPAYKDLCALGCGDGHIFVYHFGEDRCLANFRHESGSVTDLEFRRDEEGQIYSCTSLGEIALWNLETMTLAGVLTRSKQVRSRDDVLDNAHRAAVHSLVALPEQPMLISCGSDNALRQYRLDTIDGMALLVRERAAHLGACTSAAFFNSDLVLTGGEDQCFRCTHVFSDRASWEMSQGKLGKRSRDQHMRRSELQLAPITKVSSSPSRNYQWSSVVSIHRSDANVVGWRLDNRVVEFKAQPVKTGVHCCRSVAVSLCGNYAVIGYSSGHLTRLNLQDREPKHFLRFDSATKTRRPAHDGSVEEVCVAAMNSLVVSISMDETIRTWSMNDCKALREVRVGHALNAAFIHPHASIVGAACSDFGIRLYDVKAENQDFGRTIRLFKGHLAPITAVQIIPDSWRYVVSASSDGAVLVWDIATGSCVGGYRVTAPVQSIAFHPDALFMLTTHVGERGAFLWTNNLRYGFAPNVIDPSTLTVNQLPLLHFPHSQERRTEGEAEEGFAMENGEDDVDLFNLQGDIAQFKKEMEEREKLELAAIEASGLHKSSRAPLEYAALEHLDQIKERNQPLLPPKKEKAPFFMETTKEVNPTFIVKPTEAKDSKKEPDFFHHASSETPFRSSLRLHFQAAEPKHLQDCVSILNSLSVHELDLELRRLILTSEDGIENQDAADAQMAADVETFLQLVNLIVDAMRAQTHADLLQALLGHFFQLHAVTILSLAERTSSLKKRAEILSGMETLMEEQKRLRERVNLLVDYPLCLSSTFSNSFS